MKNERDLTFGDLAEVLAFDRAEYERKMRELDLAIIAECRTKIWYNPAVYIPTDREKPYARPLFPAVRTEVKNEDI